MQEYYFLFFLGGIWLLFASYKDWKTTIIPDWVSLSLISFALGYRAFYSVAIGNWAFFFYGLMGFVIFTIVALIFYYGRVFGGGDAKLLTGLGVILPFESVRGYLLFGGGFIILLLVTGFFYTLIYSAFLVSKHKREYFKEYNRLFYKWKNFFVISFFIGILTGIFYFNLSGTFWAFMVFLFFIVLPFLYLHIKSIDNSCMKVLKKPSELIEGDWLIKNVNIGGKTIRKSVHGLSKMDIAHLRKYGKKVLIKEGIPFVPAFFIAFVLGIFVYLRYSSF